MKTKHTHHVDEQYGKFLRGLQLVGIGIRTCSSRLDRSAYARIFRSKQRGQVDLRASYQVEQAKTEFFESIAKFELRVLTPSLKRPPLAIECVFETHFHAGMPITLELAKRFTDSEFRIIVWPYFRQFLADLASRMSISAPAVPLLARKSLDQ